MKATISPGEAAERYDKLHEYVQFVAGTNPNLDDGEICEIVVEE